MLIFGLRSSSDDRPSNPSNESQPKYDKRPPKLCSTSGDRPSNLSNESQLKCDKRPPKSLKNEMLVFGLHSNSDDRPSNPSNESQPKCDKRPLSHRKMKCSFLDYIQLLMIDCAMQATKVN